MGGSGFQVLIVNIPAIVLSFAALVVGASGFELKVIVGLIVDFIFSLAPVVLAAFASFVCEWISTK